MRAKPLMLFGEAGAYDGLVVQGVERLRALDAFGCVREDILPPYLLLYASGERSVHLLSIRHHRQLSFDFSGLWNDV